MADENTIKAFLKTSTLEKQKIDLIVIGNQNSGKTSLIKRFVEGSSIT